MAEDESDSPPPLPRGTYNFNFDELDEMSNPFATKKRIESSPERDENNSSYNPFQTKSKLPSTPTESAGNCEEDPFQTKSKVPHSPTGNMDNEINPFQTKSKLASSPPKEIENIEDPFKTKSKLGSSPPKDFDTDDPFKTKSKLAGSPPQHDDSFLKGRIASSEADNNGESLSETTGESQNASDKKENRTEMVSTPPLPSDDGGEDSQGEKVQDGGAEMTKQVPKLKQKKVSSPKKGSGIKKPKAKSKFKPPPNFGVQESDEVVIFAPPPPKPEPAETTLEPDQDNTVTSTAGSQNEAEQEAELREEPVSCENSSDLPNQMPGIDLGRDFGAAGAMNAMMDSVHDFGAGEMPQVNEGFVPASEAFNDEAWQMMEKLKNEDNVSHERDSLYTKFDPLLSAEEVPNKATGRHSDTETHEDNDGKDDLMLMNTPQSKQRVTRHPAARALQEHVDGDGAPKEAHVIDKMLFSPVKGEELRAGEEGERYYDAPEFPLGSKKYWAQQGDSDGDHVPTSTSSSKKPQGSPDQESIVQLVQVLKYSQSDWNRMKQESELDYNARILNKEREWSKKLADRDKKISHLEEQILLLRSSNEDMRCVVAEFEKTISQLQAEKEKSTTESQKGFEDVVKERDQALEDLQSVETAFSDLHQRYERVKGVVEGFKKNEEVLKKCVQDYQGKLKAAEEKSVSVRHQAEEKLDQANQEIEKVRKTTTAELARLEAALKKAELKIQGLDRSLEQKVKENNELTAICDELIAKVGGE